MGEILPFILLFLNKNNQEQIASLFLINKRWVNEKWENISHLVLVKGRRFSHLSDEFIFKSGWEWSD